MQTLSYLWQHRPVRFFAGLLVLVTLLRLAALAVSDINLGPDEAQYWWWSREFQFGYFSKPPVIAWMIGATTALFGNDEWAVRLSSPLAGAVTAWFVFLIARRLYDLRTALWAGIVWITVPAIMLSAGIISTDIPLLMFWAIALYAFIGLADSEGGAAGNAGRYGWAALAGAAVGFGMLSKYAMIYFPLCAALAMVLSPRARNAARPVPLFIAAALAIAVFLPNVWWNANNGFQTLEHTQANAGWSGDFFHPDEFAEFFFSQFGVGGPILFGFFLFGLLTLRRRISSDVAGSDFLALSFSLPPLVIILIQALISGANANWAMTAYPALIILVTAWMVRASHQRLLAASTLFHVAIGIVFTVIAANFAIADAIGLSNAVKRVRGWPQQVAEIERYAEDYPVIVVDDRELMGNILYYMRDSDKPVKAWDINRHVEHHYEAFDAYDPTQYDRALLVAKYPQYLYSYVEFDTIWEVGVSQMDMNVRCPRRYWLYELRDYVPGRGAADVPPPPPDFSRMIGDCNPY